PLKHWPGRPKQIGMDMSSKRWDMEKTDLMFASLHEAFGMDNIDAFRLGRSKPDFEAVRQPVIIRVKECDPVAARAPGARVSCRLGSAIPLVNQDTHPSVSPR